MKILITGRCRLLEQFLNIGLPQDHPVLSLYNKNEGNCRNCISDKIDITLIEDMKKIFRLFKPYIVIHPAAIFNPLLASQIVALIVKNTNADATKILPGSAMKVIHGRLILLQILFTTGTVDKCRMKLLNLCHFPSIQKPNLWLK